MSEPWVQYKAVQHRPQYKFADIDDVKADMLSLMVKEPHSDKSTESSSDKAEKPQRFLGCSPFVTLCFELISSVSKKRYYVYNNKINVKVFHSYIIAHLSDIVKLSPSEKTEGDKRFYLK